MFNCKKSKTDFPLKYPTQVRRNPLRWQAKGSGIIETGMPDSVICCGRQISNYHFPTNTNTLMTSHLIKSRTRSIWLSKRLRLEVEHPRCPPISVSRELDEEPGIRDGAGLGADAHPSRPPQRQNTLRNLLPVSDSPRLFNPFLSNMLLLLLGRKGHVQRLRHIVTCNRHAVTCQCHIETFLLSHNWSLCHRVSVLFFACSGEITILVLIGLSCVERKSLFLRWFSFLDMTSSVCTWSFPPDLFPVWEYLFISWSFFLRIGRKQLQVRIYFDRGSISPTLWHKVQMDWHTALSAKDAIQFHQQNCSQLYWCK